jgi:hypothetical protein
VLGRRQRDPGMQPQHVHVLGLQAAGGSQRQYLDDARACQLRLLLVADAGVGDGSDRTCELTRRCLRRAPDVRRRQLAEPRERPQPVDDVRLRREQLLAAEPEPVDQPVHVQVRASGVDRRQRRAVELQEHPDPLACLGRDLRRLGRGGERSDHVELASPRDLRAAGNVDRAELDRGARERAHDCAGVRRVGEQAQPREHVADLGALKERSLADEPVRHRSLLQRDRDRVTLARRRRDQDHDPVR